MEKNFTKEQIEAMKNDMEIGISTYRERGKFFHQDMTEEEVEEVIRNTESSLVATIVAEVTVPVEVECDYEDVPVGRVNIEILEPPFGVFYDWLDVADAMDGDVYGACEALNLDGKKFATGHTKLHREMMKLLEDEVKNVFYVRDVWVDEQFRGCGIGKHLVKKIDDIIQYGSHSRHGVIVLTACPVEIKRENTEEHAEYSEKLYKFYEDCGFTRIDEQVFLKLF